VDDRGDGEADDVVGQRVGGPVEPEADQVDAHHRAVEHDGVSDEQRPEAPGPERGDDGPAPPGRAGWGGSTVSHRRATVLAGSGPGAPGRGREVPFAALASVASAPVPGTRGGARSLSSLPAELLVNLTLRELRGKFK